jgi:hypothetical protein
MGVELQPIWFRLNKRFYTKLELVSKSAGLKAEDTLEFAVEVLGALALAARDENSNVKDFVGQLRPRIRAWRREAEARKQSIAQALEDGARLYHIHGPLNVPEPDAPIRKSPAGLAILRWANVPPEERKRKARELAAKRWKKKDSNKPSSNESSGR